MQDATSHPLRFVSVKLTPVGRAQSYALDPETTRVPRAGEAVVVQTDQGPAIGTVASQVPQLVERRGATARSAYRIGPARIA
ncbi:MAG: hypothetical protein QM731_29330 [Chitinophagaceae bacterium]